MSIEEADERPLVASLCGTYLKAEMQSLYRQIANLQRFRNVVLAEQLQNGEMFPFEPVIQMEKKIRPRQKGNFILRFWYKHVVKQWPPPRRIGPEPKPFYPYDMPQLLAEHAPDVAHVYYGHKAVKYLEMLRAWGGPWLVSFHGVDVVKFMDEDGYEDQLREVFREAKLVLARSESLLARLRELGCPDEKLRLNRTPIPLDKIPFQHRSAPENGEWRLIQACRLIPKKGLFTTLKALPMVLKEFPKLKFVLAGRGPVEEEFRAEVERMGLGDSIEMLGWLDQETLMAEYAKAHAFLHPSELTDTSDQEGVPNSMLEAMASGLPVLGTLHGGIPEAVHSGRDGLLVPEKDPEALAGAIIEMLSGGKLEDFSEAASASVRERFGFEEQIGKLEDCYAEAMTL